MVSLIATPEPDFHPPRVRLDLDSESVATFTSIQIRRDGVLLREQPFIGGTEAVVYDYEAPRGVPVTYTAEVELATWSVIRDEDWASLSGWTVTFGSAIVSGGQLIWDDGYPFVDRGFPSGLLTRGRLRIADIDDWLDAYMDLGYMRLAFDPAGVYAKFDGLLIDDVRIGPNNGGPLTATWADGKMSVTADGINWQSPGITSTTLGTPRFRVAAVVTPSPPLGGGAGPFIVDQSSVSTETVTATAQIDVDQIWLINPVAPVVSQPIDSGDCSHEGNHMSIMWPSGQDRVSEAARSLHAPVGRSRMVAITTGPRMADEWELVVKASTFVARDSLDDLLYNQSPLLLLIPPHIRWGLPDGWHSVGTVSKHQYFQAAVGEQTLFTLPMTPIDPPAVQQGAVRTWGDVLGEAATWDALVDKYDTWLDVLVGD